MFMPVIQAYTAVTKDLACAIVGLKDWNQIILLDPHPDANFHDHEFESPTFKPILEQHMNLYTDQNGEFDEKMVLPVIDNTTN